MTGMVPKRVFLSCLLSVFIAVFTLLSFWNSHKAIKANNPPNSVGHRPSAKWVKDNTMDDLVYENGNRNMLSLPQPVCLTEACLQAVAHSISHNYPVRPKESWCIHTEARGENSFENEQWQGLLLVKVPKAASSTSAGLALRIGNRTNCAVQWEHREGHNYVNRSRNSFLFGSVRRPASRNLSSVWFFMIAPLDIEPTDNNIIRSLHTHRGGKTKGKGMRP